MLLEQLGSESIEQRKGAREALAAMGVAAMPALLAALVEEPSTADRGDLASLLRKVGEPALQPLIDILASAPSKEVARWASYAMTGLELSDLGPLVPALAHPEAQVRRVVACVFQAKKESALPYAAMLTPLLDDPDESVRERAVWMFKEIGPGATAVLRDVHRRKGPVRLRRTALEALAGTSGPAGLDEVDLAALRG
jgi:HEAT repeat protein